MFNENKCFLAEEVAVVPRSEAEERTSRPRLYRNLGPDGFRDVTAEVGLDRAVRRWAPTSATSTTTDFSTSTSAPAACRYEYLVPNRMFHNVGRPQFEDVTVATGTGHLQKGHGVSFAD